MRIDVVSAAPILATNAAAAAQAQQGQQGVQSAPAVQATEAVTLPRVAPVEAQAEEKDPVFSIEDVEKLVKRGNTLFEELRLHEQFQLIKHDRLDRTMIRLVDVQQDRVIREFPPKKYLDLIAALQDLTGLFFDERV